MIFGALFYAVADGVFQVFLSQAFLGAYCSVRRRDACVTCLKECLWSGERKEGVTVHSAVIEQTCLRRVCFRCAALNRGHFFREKGRSSFANNSFDGWFGFPTFPLTGSAQPFPPHRFHPPE